MPDDSKRKTPAPFGVPITPAVERQSTRGHREHARRPSQGEVEVTFDDEYTDQYEVGDITAEELAELRASRPDRVRLAILEKNHDDLRRELQDVRADAQDDADALRAELGGVKVAVADMNGQMKVIPDLVGAMKDATKALRERDHVKFTAEVDVGKARAMDAIDADKTDRKDKLDANKAKRQWITKALAIVASLAAALATGIAAGRC